MKKLLYEITHTTTYDYVGEVSVSHHLLRLAPSPSRTQDCLEHELSIEPAPATITAHRDYFGNSTHYLSVETSHRQLVIRSRGRVAVGPAFIPDPTETPAWESVRAACPRRRAWGQWFASS